MLQIGIGGGLHVRRTNLLLALSKLRADGWSDVGRQVEDALEIFRLLFIAACAHSKQILMKLIMFISRTVLFVN